MTEPIAGIGGWLVDQLFEHGLVWLLKQPLFLLGMDLPIGVWVVLALAVVILVAVLIARLVDVLIAWWNGESDAAKDLPQSELRQHVWASVFWALAILAILLFLGW